MCGQEITEDCTFVDEVCEVCEGNQPVHNINQSVQDAVITTPNGENLPVTALHGTELEFTVTPAEGFVVTEVKVNGETVEAVEGVYTITVKATVNIDVTTQEESAVPAEPTIATSIKVGDKVILACDAKKVEFNGFPSGKTYGEYVNYTDLPAGAVVLEVEAGSQDGTFALKMPDGAYLQHKGSKNTLTASNEINNNSSWNISFNGETATITNVADSSRKLQYNASSTGLRFACYTSDQTAVNLFIVG